jgi:hypothetical protein
MDTVYALLNGYVSSGWIETAIICLLMLQGDLTASTPAELAPRGTGGRLGYGHVNGGPLETPRSQPEVRDRGMFQQLR